MVVTEERHVCEDCNEAYPDADAAQVCEKSHQVEDLVERVVDARITPSRFQTYMAIQEFLEATLVHGHATFGMEQCPDCDASVHHLWEQCPECGHPVDVEPDGYAELFCSSCGSTALHLMKKSGNTRAFGIRCQECDSFVAHLGGYVSFEQPGENTDGEWRDLES